MIKQLTDDQKEDIEYYYHKFKKAKDPEAKEKIKKQLDTILNFHGVTK